MTFPTPRSAQRVCSSLTKVLDTDEAFSYTFTKAGNYPSYCTIHPKMTGKVVVQ
jgi:plastocyanin